MNVYIGADHRGFELKEYLKTRLAEDGYEVVDCGNTELDPLDDYVDHAELVAKRVATAHSKNEDALGILICGSGAGVCIAANRIKTIRCAYSTSEDHAAHVRENDHANVLALASDYTTPEGAYVIARSFLTTLPKMVEKYLRRVEKLDKIS